MSVDNKTNVTPEKPEENVLKGIGHLKEDELNQAKDQEIIPNRNWRDEGKKILTSGLS
jgi:hypothetical protein